MFLSLKSRYYRVRLISNSGTRETTFVSVHINVTITHVFYYY